MTTSKRKSKSSKKPATKIKNKNKLVLSPIDRFLIEYYAKRQEGFPYGDNFTDRKELIRKIHTIHLEGRKGKKRRGKTKQTKKTHR